MAPTEDVIKILQSNGKITSQTETISVKTVETPQDELNAAKMLAEAEAHLRRIEESRVKVTAPLNSSLKQLNQTAKESSHPFALIKEELQKRLGSYRARPDVREKIALRERAEMKFRMAEKQGDLEGMRNYGMTIRDIDGEVPRSVTGGNGMVVRYRSKRTFEVNEEELDERYFKRVPDEQMINAALDAGQVVNGVTEKVTYTPYAVAVDSKE